MLWPITVLVVPVLLVGFTLFKISRRYNVYLLKVSFELRPGNGDEETAFGWRMCIVQDPK